MDNDDDDSSVDQSINPRVGFRQSVQPRIRTENELQIQDRTRRNQPNNSRNRSTLRGGSTTTAGIERRSGATFRNSALARSVRHATSTTFRNSTVAQTLRGMGRSSTAQAQAQAQIKLKRRPKLLVLHGYKSNAEIARLQIENLGLNSNFEVTYLDGLFQGNEPADENVGMLSDGPYYSWYEVKQQQQPGEQEEGQTVDISHNDNDAEEETKVRTQQLLNSLRYVLKHLEAMQTKVKAFKEKGTLKPYYDAVYGFSQGAVVASILSCDRLVKALRERNNLHPMVIMAGSAGLARQSIAAEIADVPPTMSENAVPSRRVSMLRKSSNRMMGRLRGMRNSDNPSSNGSTAEGGTKIRRFRSNRSSRRNSKASAMGGTGGMRLMPQDTVVSTDDEAWYTRPCWNFVFLACAGDPQIITFVKRELFPASLDIMEESFNFKEASRSTLSSVHFIGINDPLKGKSESYLTNTFNDNIAYPVYLNGGHEISAFTSKARRDVILVECMAWYTKYRLEDFETLSNTKQIYSYLTSMHGPGEDSSSDKDDSDNEGEDNGPLEGAHVLAVAMGEVPFLSIISEMQHFEKRRKEVAQNSPSSMYGKKQSKDVALLESASHGQYVLNRICQTNSLLSHVLSMPDPKKDAIWSPGLLQPLTYGDLSSFIKDQGDLRKIGAKSEDFLIAYIAPPGVLSAVAFLSICAQCTAVPFDPEYSEKDFIVALEQLKPNIVIAFEECASADSLALASENANIPCFKAKGNERGLFEYTTHLDDEEFDMPRLLSSPTNIALILRTSGSTSKPKVVPIKMNALVSNSRIIAKNLGLKKEDVALNAMPLFHIGGLSSNLLSSLAAGAAVIIMESFDVISFFNIVTKAEEVNLPKPTWYSAVPTMHATICDVADNDKNLGKHTLRFIRSGAAALSVELGKRMEDIFGVHVVSTYSMTEQMPISQPPTGISMITEKPGSVGRSVATSMCIVDQNMRPLPLGSNKTGEICISGPSVTEGYLENEKANVNAYFLMGGMTWFRTGDTGMLDTDSYLFLTGRQKELIKRGGDQVSPYEVEDAIARNETVKVCVVFAIPDKLWGQRVGAAIILSGGGDTRSSKEAILTEEEFQKMIRAYLIKEEKLHPYKVPEIIVFVTEDELPKTRSKKYIRLGLAEKLGVEEIDEVTDLKNQLKPVKIHEAVIGVRFILACWVFFNHVGDFGESWGFSRSFCVHPPAFFFLGGFLLAASTHVPVVKDLTNFYAIRLAVLHPMYLCSLLCVTINFAIFCTPSNYIEDFQYDRQPVGDDTFICQSAIVEMPYWATMLTSLFSYILGLQCWPFAIPFQWFLSKYAWFSGVYIFCVAVFPWIHKKFYDIRSSSVALWGHMRIWFVLHYLYIIVFFFNDAIYNDDNLAGNIFAINAYLFPPGWLPSFAMGIGGYFLFSHYRPHEKLDAWKWGVITDALSVLFCIFFLLHGFRNDDFTKDSSGRGKRIWAYTLSRLICPSSFVWIYGLAVGEGWTADLMSRKSMVVWLAPASYNIYLFHQVTYEWYWLATRGEYWAYPRDFYWFSPKYSPIRVWEFFILLFLTVLLSIILEFRLNSILVEWSALLVQKLTGKDSLVIGKEASVTQVLIQIIGNITGGEVDESTSLLESGLSSITSLVLIAKIKQHFKSLVLTSRDIFEVDTVGEFSALIAERLQRTAKNGGGYEFNTSTKINRKASVKQVHNAIDFVALQRNTFVQTDASDMNVMASPLDDDDSDNESSSSQFHAGLEKV